MVLIMRVVLLLYICNRLGVLNVQRCKTSNTIIDLYFKKDYVYHNVFNEWFKEFLDITKINNFDKNKGLNRLFIYI